MRRPAGPRRGRSYLLAALRISLVLAGLSLELEGAVQIGFEEPTAENITVPLSPPKPAVPSGAAHRQSSSWGRTVAALGFTLAVMLGCVERPKDRGGHSLYCTMVYIDPLGVIQSAHRKLMPRQNLARHLTK